MQTAKGESQRLSFPMGALPAGLLFVSTMLLLLPIPVFPFWIYLFILLVIDVLTVIQLFLLLSCWFFLVVVMVPFFMKLMYRSMPDMLERLASLVFVHQGSELLHTSAAMVCLLH